MQCLKAVIEWFLVLASAGSVLQCCLSTCPISSCSLPICSSPTQSNPPSSTPLISHHQVLWFELLCFFWPSSLPHPIWYHLLSARVWFLHLDFSWCFCKLGGERGGGIRRPNAPQSPPCRDHSLRNWRQTPSSLSRFPSRKSSSIQNASSCAVQHNKRTHSSACWPMQSWYTVCAKQQTILPWKLLLAVLLPVPMATGHTCTSITTASMRENAMHMGGTIQNIE